MSEQADEAAPRPRRGRLLILAGVGLLVVVGAGGGAAWYLLGGGASVAAPGDPATSHQEVLQPAEPATVFVDLPELLVNLRSDGQRLRYLKLKLALEVAGEVDADKVRGLTPRIVDSFQLYLRALDVAEVEGAAGMQRLKEELLDRVHAAVGARGTRDVLVREMLVQ
jgi:flagellar FliL protein